MAAVLTKIPPISFNHNFASTANILGLKSNWLDLQYIFKTWSSWLKCELRGCEALFWFTVEDNNGWYLVLLSSDYWVSIGLYRQLILGGIGSVWACVTLYFEKVEIWSGDNNFWQTLKDSATQLLWSRNGTRNIMFTCDSRTLGVSFFYGWMKKEHENS